MKTNSTENILENSHAMRAILWGGLIAGVLDITAAVVTTIVRGGRPTRMLQSIASGVLGAGSYQGGLKTAALGLLLHFVIAFGATIVFYAASRKLRLLVRQAIISGLLYGIAVYFFMNLVVSALSYTDISSRLLPRRVPLYNVLRFPTKQTIRLLREY